MLGQLIRRYMRTTLYRFLEWTFFAPRRKGGKRGAVREIKHDTSAKSEKRRRKRNEKAKCCSRKLRTFFPCWNIWTALNLMLCFLIIVLNSRGKTKKRIFNIFISHFSKDSSTFRSSFSAAAGKIRLSKSSHQVVVVLQDRTLEWLIICSRFASRRFERKKANNPFCSPFL